MAFFGKAQTMVEEALVKERENVGRRPEPAVLNDLLDEEQMAEYTEVAASIGLESPEMTIEAFRQFLNKHDMPVFSLTEVVRYMDELTARDNPSKLGWHWRPVREKDRRDLRFGTPSVHDQSGLFQGALGHPSASGGLAAGLSGGSLTFVGSTMRSVTALEMAQIQAAQAQGVVTQALAQSLSYNGPTHKRPSSDYYDRSASVYTRAVPLHALRKIALVEKKFSGSVSFMITEYTTEAHVVIRPDPFLMAVVPNDRLTQGHGRFVIDVWDEPGFGIDRMVK